MLTARDGESALTLLAEDKGAIGVLVTDLAMPKMNGLSLIRELRARGKAVEVVVMLGKRARPGKADGAGRASRASQTPSVCSKLIEALESAFADR